MMEEIGLKMFVAIVALSGDGLTAIVSKLELNVDSIGGWN